LFELFADGIHGGVAAVQKGNPNLEEERSINTDLSLRWDSPGLSTRLNLYRNKIDNFIFLLDTGNTQSGLPVFVHRQDDAVLKGIEFELKAALTSSLELRLVYDAVNGENQATGDDIPLLPADELQVEGTWSLSEWGFFKNPFVRLGMRYNASKQAAPGEPFEQFDQAPFGTASTESYTVGDLSIGFDYDGFTGIPVQFKLDVRNFTDKAYRDFLDTYKGYALSPGRDVQFGIQIPFGPS